MIDLNSCGHQIKTDSKLFVFYVQSVSHINKDLEMQRLAKTNDKNRRFGVIMTPLSRRNKK